MTYSMTCSCGDVLKVTGRTRAKAVRHMKALLSELELYEHMAQKHIGDDLPTIQQVHAVIEQSLKSA